MHFILSWSKCGVCVWVYVWEREIECVFQCISIMRASLRALYFHLALCCCVVTFSALFENPSLSEDFFTLWVWRQSELPPTDGDWFPRLCSGVSVGLDLYLVTRCLCPRLWIWVLVPQRSEDSGDPQKFFGMLWLLDHFHSCQFAKFSFLVF